MADYRFGKKKTFKEKANDGLRKTFAVAALAGVTAVPVYYNYGTITTDTVKVNDYDQHMKWNDSDEKATYQYEFKTNKGSFWDKNSALHAKFSGQTASIWDEVQKGRTYDVKYYGTDFLFLKRNILTLNEVSEDELKARAAARKEEARQQAVANMPGAIQKSLNQNGANPGVVQPGVNPQQPAVPGAVVGALSGRMIVQDLVSTDGKSSVQVTIPVEAVGKVSVNSVINLQPAPPAPRAPGT